MKKRLNDVWERITSFFHKKEKDSIKWDKSKVKFFSTLRFKLFALFLVPVACIIILGVVSYTWHPPELKTTILNLLPIPSI